MSQFVKCLALDETNKEYKSLEVNTTGELLISSATLATEATLSSLDSKLVACDTSLMATEATLLSLDGKITACDTSLLATDASLALVARETTLSSLNGKITACDTSSLATEATLSLVNGKITACDTTGLATETTLSTLNGKITACDTSSLATESTLVSLNGKITACDTSSLATEATLVSLNGKITACDTSGLATNATLALVATEATLSSIDGKITTCDTSGLATQATLASVDTNVSTLSSTVTAGKVQVEFSTTDKGSRGNIENNATISSTGLSSLSPSIVGFGKDAHLYYEDTLTGNFDGIAIEISLDGTNYSLYDIIYPTDNYNSSKREASVAVNCSGADNIRIRNLASVNATGVVCSIVA